MTNNKNIASRQPRHKLTRELLLTHIEALATAPSIQDAANELQEKYPTFLATFRRAGLKATEVRESVLDHKVMPEVIVSQVFAKIEKKAKPKKVLDFKELAKMLQTVSAQLNQAAQAA